MKYLFLFCLVLTIGTVNAQSISSPEGKRFNVDDVKVAQGPQAEIKAQFAFELALNKEVQFFPDELKDQTVVSGWGNNFVHTIHTSFDQHRPLSLTPDVIWLTIAQGISIHINENFDELESYIFKADKPNKIRVRNDGLADGSVHWVDLLSAFSDSTTKYVNDDYYRFFVAEFSTTTNIDMTSYEVTMLEGFSQAFEYFGDSGCGIPYITLKGTRDDWQAIYDRLDKVEELGMTVWAEELRMVVQKFIDVFDDNVDLDFWQSIYKDHNEYGADYVSGWFIKFFPYLQGTGKIEQVSDENPYVYARAPKVYIPNKYLKGDQYLISRLNTSDFPSGIAEIDVHWNNRGIEREMKVHAGFYGSKQYGDLSLEPAIAWAVVDQSASNVDHDYKYVDNDVEHRHVYWSPEVMAKEKLEELAIYGLTASSDSLKNDKNLKINIAYNLKYHSPYSLEDMKGKTIKILISSKGTFLECQGENVDEDLLGEITKIVRSLPEKWRPAKTDFRNIAPDFYDENDDGTILLVPVNSWVSLKF